MTLFYHKCGECLTAFACVEPKVDECDCGSTDITFMGRVQGDQYVNTVNRCPCDGRCTHAMGPTCDCSCGGVNHGTGRVVPTTVVGGKIKVTNPSADIYDDMVRGYKYRELRDKAEEIYAAVFGVDNLSWSYEGRVARHDLNKALELRVYDRRHNAILNFVLKYVSKVPKKEMES